MRRQDRRCGAIGDQTLLVRTDGRADVVPGQPIRLHWSPSDAHAFGADGRRI